MKTLSKAVLIAVMLAVPAVGICAGTVYKIGDVYSKKDALDKKQISVRGKVTKVSAGIMNRTWVHLQDGKGKEHDLTVTTSQDAPAVGKTVTATGTLAKGKDFGSGYYYDVILEQATFK